MITKGRNTEHRDHTAHGSQSKYKTKKKLITTELDNNTGLRGEKLKEKNHLEDLIVDGRIIQKLILNE